MKKVRKATWLFFAAPIICLIINSGAWVGASVKQVDGPAYILSVDGEPQAFFSEVSGLPTIKKTAQRPSIIAFKEGRSNRIFAQRCRELIKAKRSRVRLELVFIDSFGKQKGHWLLLNSRPVKFDGPDLNAKGEEVSIETLEFLCEYIEVIDDDD